MIHLSETPPLDWPGLYDRWRLPLPSSGGLENYVKEVECSAARWHKFQDVPVVTFPQFLRKIEESNDLI